MAKYRIIYLGAVAALAGLYVASGKEALLAALVFLLLAEALSLLFLYLASRDVSICFHAREQCVVGKTLPVQVSVTSGRRLPFGMLRLDMVFSNTLFENSREIALFFKASWKDSSQFEMPYTPTDCGKVEITVARAVCYDLFGLLSKKITRPADMSVVVYPHIPDIQVREVSRPRSQQSSDQYDQSRRGQDVTEVFDMRDYQEGDSLRSIHWKLSSKLDRLTVREFAEPICYETMLFYDSGAYGGNPTPEDHAVMNAVLGMTAALSKSLMENNLPHCVLSLPYQVLDRTLVDNRNAYQTMLDKLMYGRIQDSAVRQLAYFSEMGIYQEFSKVIVVTGRIKQDVLRKIAETASVTAIELSKSGAQQVEQNGNMELIKISLKEFEETVHAIEI